MNDKKTSSARKRPPGSSTASSHASVRRPRAKGIWSLAGPSAGGVVQAVAALSDEERLIAGLDPITRRDLVAMRPGAAETMQQIGVSKTNLDGPVRTWINVTFRAPHGRAALTRGTIKSATTWTQLLGML